MVTAAYGLSCLPYGVQMSIQQEWIRSSLMSLDQTQKTDIAKQKHCMFNRGGNYINYSDQFNTDEASEGLLCQALHTKV